MQPQVTLHVRDTLRFPVVGSDPRSPDVRIDMNVLRIIECDNRIALTKEVITDLLLAWYVRLRPGYMNPVMERLLAQMAAEDQLGVDLVIS